MEHEPSPQTLNNERRDFFRVEDKVLLRYQAIDESSALANNIPPQFAEELGYSLLRDLQQLDSENSVHLRALAEQNRDLEQYLKAINSKIDAIAQHLAKSSSTAQEQHNTLISLSEGGLALRTDRELANDSYVALQLTLLPSHISLVLFARVINCSAQADEFSVALSFVHLKEYDRLVLTKHIMQIQLAERRQQNNEPR